MNLNQLYVFQDLSDSEAQYLWELVQERLYLPWEEIITKWDEISTLYLVVDWSIDVIDEYRLMSHFSWNNMLWAFLIFKTNDKWNKSIFTYKATEPTNVIVIPKFIFSDLKKNNPDILLKILEKIKIEKHIEFN